MAGYETLLGLGTITSPNPIFICRVTLGEPVNKPLDSKVLQELVEWTGGFLSLVKKTLMRRRRNVFDTFGHYRMASR